MHLNQDRADARHDPIEDSLGTTGKNARSSGVLASDVDALSRPTFASGALVGCMCKDS